MDASELSACASLAQFEQLAEDFVNAYTSGDSEALRRMKDHYKLDRQPSREELRVHAQQCLRKLRKSENRSANFALADARDLIADSQGFESWQALSKHIEVVNQDRSPISQFESAVDAVIAGDVATLESLLRNNPELIRARSTRVHRATLLHYVSANGVEDFRQRTPPNAVEVAELLLRAGAAADAPLVDGESTTLGLVATSIHPAHAGVLIALLELLLEHGAAIDGIPGELNPLIAALQNGRPEAAAFLARRGARLDLEAAAGVGRLEVVMSFVNDDGSLKPAATKAQMESGFMWACEYGHTSVVEFLLDKGLDAGTQVNGMTGLHWAMVGGRSDTIKLLLQREAPLEVENNYGGTVLGCATWAVGHSDPVYRWPDTDTDWVTIVQMLIEAGARVYEGDPGFPTGNEGVDELLRRHGMKP